MDEENVVQMHNGILLSHKKEFAITWVDLELVILSEVSQAEKDKHHEISFTHGISFLKKVTNKFIYKTETHRHRKKKWLPKGNGGEGIIRSLRLTDIHCCCCCC